MSHRGSRLCSVFRHPVQDVLHILIGIAEHLVQAVAHGLRMMRQTVIRNRQITEMTQMEIQPFSVWICMNVFILAFLIVHNLFLHGIHQEKFSRHQTGLFYDVFLIKIQNAHFGRQYQPVVIQNVITCRAQSVAVKTCADAFPVGKDNRRWSVPWLHHGGVVMVEILLLLRDGIIVFPRFGNHDHQRERKIDFAHIQEFQCVIDHCRVGTLITDHRIDAVQIRFRKPGLHGFLPRHHAIMVAGYRIDLPVMRNHPVGMSTVPARRGIG